MERNYGCRSRHAPGRDLVKYVHTYEYEQGRLLIGHSSTYLYCRGNSDPTAGALALVAFVPGRRDVPLDSPLIPSLPHPYLGGGAVESKHHIVPIDHFSVLVLEQDPAAPHNGAPPVHDVLQWVILNQVPLLDFGHLADLHGQILILRARIFSYHYRRGRILTAQHLGVESRAGGASMYDTRVESLIRGHRSVSRLNTTDKSGRGWIQ